MKTAGGVSLGERLLCLLFPARCLLCGELISSDRLFCPACAADVPEKPFERRYSLPAAGADGFRVVSPMSYEGGFRKTLHSFKFGGQTALAKPLGRLMSQALGASEPFDGVTWVPMTKRKKRQRGYDQSELLARSAAKALKLPVLPLLKKVRETDVQHELSKKGREKNVKKAYQAGPEAAGKSLLLVDDIVTTGSTLRECAGALYAAGAKRVTGLCAADAQETRLEGGVQL